MLAKSKKSTLLALVRGIHRWPGISPHKGPATREKRPFDDVIMTQVKITATFTNMDQLSRVFEDMGN